MSEWVLRAAMPHDAAAVADVMIRSRHVHQPYAPLAHDEADVRRWVRDHLLPSHSTIVACVPDGRVVGFIASSVQDQVAWISQLHFARDHTGQGGGTMLLRQALEALPRPVRLYTFQPNRGARRFYERHGFQAVEFGDGSGNEEGCPDVLYELHGLGRTAISPPSQ